MHAALCPRASVFQMTFHPFRLLNSLITRAVSAILEPSSKRMISDLGALRSKLARQRVVTKVASWIGTTIDIDALDSMCSRGCSKTLFQGKPRLNSLLLIRFLIRYRPSITTCGKALFTRPGRRYAANKSAELPQTASTDFTKPRCECLGAEIRNAPAHIEWNEFEDYQF